MAAPYVAPGADYWDKMAQQRNRNSIGFGKSEAKMRREVDPRSKYKGPTTKAFEEVYKGIFGADPDTDRALVRDPGTDASTMVIGTKGGNVARRKLGDTELVSINRRRKTPVKQINAKKPAKKAKSTTVPEQGDNFGDYPSNTPY